MERYESKQVQIMQPDHVIYSTLSDFSNFTPILKDKVEEWSATSDTCSFKAKGFSVKLRMTEKEPCTTVKICGEDGSPFDFSFWLQLKAIDSADTRMRLVLDIELNMMMKMMIGGKIKDALDQIVDQIAASFNANTYN